VVYYGLDQGKLVNLLAVYKPHRLPAWTGSSNRVPATADQALSIFEQYSWDRRILDLVRNIDGDTSFWALVDLPRLPRWSRGRVMLLGDAAHAPLPHQGQGAGLAIEDAYALGALLGQSGLTDCSAVFEAFEDLRGGRRWSRPIHEPPDGPTNSSAMQQQPETQAGRHCRSELDGFTGTERRRWCHCHRGAVRILRRAGRC
jgi:hypothetical protein